jgi:hypothetical protein
MADRLGARCALTLGAAVIGLGLAAVGCAGPADQTGMAAGPATSDPVRTTTTHRAATTAPVTTTRPATTVTVAAPPTVPPVTAPPTTVTPPTVAAPPPPSPPPPTAAPRGGAGCHPSYTPCVPITSDVDCAGGSGNGPAYVGRVTVIGPDEYGLDRDGDGIGCE